MENITELQACKFQALILARTNVQNVSSINVDVGDYKCKGSSADTIIVM